MHPAILPTIAAVIALPLCGIILGLVQHAWYRRRVAAGALAEDEVPFFGLLLLRGMLAGMVLVGGGAIAVHTVTGTPPAGAAAPATNAPAPTKAP